MACLMVIQGSGRKKGFTASLMENVVQSLAGVKGLDVEVYHLHDYAYGPCKSCFHCIRNVGSGCILDDDWGRNRNGGLFQAGIGGWITKETFIFDGAALIGFFDAGGVVRVAS